MRWLDSGFDIAFSDAFAFLSYLVAFWVDLTLGLTLCHLSYGWRYSLLEKSDFTSIVALQTCHLEGWSGFRLWQRVFVWLVVQKGAVSMRYVMGKKWLQGFSGNFPGIFFSVVTSNFLGDFEFVDVSWVLLHWEENGFLQKFLGQSGYRANFQCCDSSGHFKYAFRPFLSIFRAGSILWLSSW